MKKYGKILFAGVIIFMITVFPAFSQDIPQLSDLKKTVEDFSEAMAKSLPFNSTMGLNWSEAYIGQFFSIPPKFGFGVSAGATLMNLGSINSVLKTFGLDAASEIDIPIGLPLPGYTVEARIGGFVLPFDLGLKVGYLKFEDMFGTGLGLDYMLVGGDIRYSLLPKAIPILKVSAGLGFNHLNGGISYEIKELGSSFAFGPNDDYSLNISAPKVGLEWKTNVLDFKVQASANLLIFTPYAGLGLCYGWSQAGYKIGTEVTVKEGDEIVDLDDDVKKLMENTGGISNITEAGFEAMEKVGAVNVRAFGGFAINLTVFKIDFTGMYNFTSKDVGLTIGARFQL